MNGLTYVGAVAVKKWDRRLWLMGIGSLIMFPVNVLATAEITYPTCGFFVFAPFWLIPGIP